MTRHGTVPSARSRQSYVGHARLQHPSHQENPFNRPPPLPPYPTASVPPPTGYGSFSTNPFDTSTYEARPLISKDMFAPRTGSGGAPSSSGAYVFSFNSSGSSLHYRPPTSQPPSLPPYTTSNGAYGQSVYGTKPQFYVPQASRPNYPQQTHQHYTQPTYAAAPYAPHTSSTTPPQYNSPPNGTPNNLSPQHNVTSGSNGSTEAAYQPKKYYYGTHSSDPRITAKKGAPYERTPTATTAAGIRTPYKKEKELLPSTSSSSLHRSSSREGNVRIPKSNSKERVHSFDDEVIPTLRNNGRNDEAGFGGGGIVVHVGKKPKPKEKKPVAVTPKASTVVSPRERERERENEQGEMKTKASIKKGRGRSRSPTTTPAPAVSTPRNKRGGQRALSPAEKERDGGEGGEADLRAGLYDKKEVKRPKPLVRKSTPSKIPRTPKKRKKKNGNKSKKAAAKEREEREREEREREERERKEREEEEVLERERREKERPVETETEEESKASDNLAKYVWEHVESVEEALEKEEERERAREAGVILEEEEEEEENAGEDGWAVEKEDETVKKRERGNNLGRTIPGLSIRVNETEKDLTKTSSSELAVAEGRKRREERHRRRKKHGSRSPRSPRSPRRSPRSPRSPRHSPRRSPRRSPRSPRSPGSGSDGGRRRRSRHRHQSRSKSPRGSPRSPHSKRRHKRDKHTRKKKKAHVHLHVPKDLEYTDDTAVSFSRELFERSPPPEKDRSSLATNSYRRQAWEAHEKARERDAQLRVEEKERLDIPAPDSPVVGHFVRVKEDAPGKLKRRGSLEWVADDLHLMNTGSVILFDGIDDEEEDLEGSGMDPLSSTGYTSVAPSLPEYARSYHGMPTGSAPQRRNATNLHENTFSDPSVEKERRLYEVLLAADRKKEELLKKFGATAPIISNGLRGGYPASTGPSGSPAPLAPRDNKTETTKEERQQSVREAFDRLLSKSNRLQSRDSFSAALNAPDEDAYNDEENAVPGFEGAATVVSQPGGVGVDHAINEEVEEEEDEEVDVVEVATLLHVITGRETLPLNLSLEKGGGGSGRERGVQRERMRGQSTSHSSSSSKRHSMSTSTSTSTGLGIKMSRSLDSIMENGEQLKMSETTLWLRQQKERAVMEEQRERRLRRKGRRAKNRRRDEYKAQYQWFESIKQKASSRTNVTFSRTPSPEKGAFTRDSSPSKKSIDSQGFRVPSSGDNSPVKAPRRKLSDEERKRERDKVRTVGGQLNNLNRIFDVVSGLDHMTIKHSSGGGGGGGGSSRRDSDSRSGSSSPMKHMRRDRGMPVSLSVDFLGAEGGPPPELPPWNMEVENELEAFRH